MIYGALIGVAILGILLLLSNRDEPRIDTRTRQIRGFIRMVSFAMIFVPISAVIGSLFAS